MLLMMAFAIYAASQMGWIRASLFLPQLGAG